MRDSGIEYRDYQIDGLDAGLSAFEEEGFDSALEVLPTGCGKTVLAGMFVEKFIEQGKKTLFVAHREVLIEQAYSTMNRFGFDTAMEMGRFNAQTHAAEFGHAQVVVGSVQTLQDDRLMSWPTDHFGQIIIDECHRSLANSYTKFLNWFRGYKLLGITATPTRGDRRNLGARFQTKAFEYSLRRAIKEGWLAQILIRTCPINIDLRGLKTTGGDFNVGDLESRLMPKMEQMARALIKEIGQRPTVAFTPDVGSAKFLAEMLTALGVSARYVAGTGGAYGMNKAERKQSLADFNRGDYQVIVCCELLVEGWDCPRVEAVGILRPTLQQYRYSQMIGRGTRKSDATGKFDCLVIDFDWETDPDVKDLCCSVSLFDDGSVDEDVFAECKRIASERAVDIDPIEIIDEAERICSTRRKFQIKLTGKEATYAAWDHDPIGVGKILDITLNRKYDLDKTGSNPASAAQLGKLRSLGVFTPEGLSKWGASKMIGKLLKRQEQGLASHAQVQALMSSGVAIDAARAMKSDRASQALQEIATINRPTQGVLFQ